MTQGSLYTSHLSGHLLQHRYKYNPAPSYTFNITHLSFSRHAQYKSDHAVAHSTIYTRVSRHLYNKSDVTRRDDKRAGSRLYIYMFTLWPIRPSPPSCPACDRHTRSQLLVGEYDGITINRYADISELFLDQEENTYQYCHILCLYSEGP